MRRIRFAFLAFVIVSVLAAQGPQALSPGVKPFVTVEAPVFALTHVRVIDGTGAPAREDQTLVVSAGKIQAVGDAALTAVPPGAKVLELRDYTVIPGLVGMHDHIFYPAGPGHYNTLEFSAPRLYLACGVTTIRTTAARHTPAQPGAGDRGGGSPAPNSVTSRIRRPGPSPADVALGPEEVRRMVSIGMMRGSAFHFSVSPAGWRRSSKRCTNARRSRAILLIDSASGRSDRQPERPVYGHGVRCRKKPDVCPPSRESREAFLKLDVSGPEILETIRQLVGHKVAITSTLPVFEISAPGRPPLQPRVLEAMAPETRINYLTQRARVGEIKDSPMPALLKKEMEFERAFVQAGGLLLAGPDPTGYGGVLPGFGDQREVELLVEAGFAPVEAIRIATLNGALYLNRADKIGTLEPGKAADMVLIKGDPAKNIADIQKVETVFKDGVGYDSAKLIESVRGTVGIR
jgi:hypothetical protein